MSSPLLGRPSATGQGVATGSQVKERTRSRLPLSLAVAQPRCVPKDLAANVAAHAAVVRRAASRVVAFPELSLTGYDLDAPLVAVDDPRLTPLVEACAEVGTLALVGAPVASSAGQPHIAMLAVTGDGVEAAYRKLYVDGSETPFVPGPAPAVLEVGGWRLGLAICRDTAFDQHWSDTAALGIDAYVAGLVMTSEEREKQDSRARAIARNLQVWVAFASFAGPTGEGYDVTAGGSGIWAADGRQVACAGVVEGGLARAELV